MIAVSLRPSGRKWGTISFASTLHLRPVLDLLLADIPVRWQSDLRLGLQEALVNAAKHGNNLDPGKTVLVEFFVLEDQYWWIISDQGKGFSPGCLCSCSALEAEEQDINQIGECGRGLYILHQIFDQVHWNQKGTELRLCKQFKGRSKMDSVD